MADYGPEFGSGHLSRLRGIVQFLNTKNQNLIDFYLAEIYAIPVWLKELIVMDSYNCYDEKTLELSAYDVLIVDSYRINIWKNITNSFGGKLIAFLDSNNFTLKLKPNVFKVRLEFISNERKHYGETLLPISGSKNTVLGTLIWNDQLESVYNARIGTHAKQNFSNFRIVINFGGSNGVGSTLKSTLMALDILSLTMQIQNVNVFVFEELLDELSVTRLSNLNINFHKYSDDYYEKLKVCDLLICASGTSGLEAYHLAIPSVIFELFQNSVDNFRLLSNIFLDASFVASQDRNSVEKIIEKISLRLSTKNISLPNKSSVISTAEKNQILQFISNQ